MARESNSTGRRRWAPMFLQLGCGQLIAILLSAGLLLLFDTLAVSLAYQTWIGLREERRHDPRIAQTILIICPLILLFLQYWLYDRVRNWLSWPLADQPEERTRN
jgi:hypothetical protein